MGALHAHVLFNCCEYFLFVCILNQKTVRRLYKNIFRGFSKYRSIDNPKIFPGVM